MSPLAAPQTDQTVCVPLMGDYISDFVSSALLALVCSQRLEQREGTSLD